MAKHQPRKKTSLQPSIDVTIRVPWWTGRALADGSTETFWITGGLGSGKTYGACLWFLDRCFQNAQSAFSWAVAPTHAKVRDILVPTFREILLDHYGMQSGVHYELHISSPPRLVFRDISHQVHFHSGARADLMIGTNISHYLITEVGTQKEEVYIKAQTRARCPRAKFRQGLCEGTPEGMNWYEKRANFGNNKADAKQKETLSRRFTLWTEDNTALPGDYVDKLKRTFGYDPAKLESYLYGRFVPFTKGTAYWEFFASRNVIYDANASPYLPLVFSWDFGVSPLAWVALQQQPTERYGRRVDRFVAVGEGAGGARGIMDACAEFVVQFDPAIYRHTPILIDGGHDGYHGTHLARSCAYEQIKRVLSKYYTNVQLVAERSAPTIEASLNKVAALFAYELCVVGSQCRNLIRSLEQSSLKPGTWELAKPKDSDPTHFADALRASLFRQTKHIDLHNAASEAVLGLNVSL